MESITFLNPALLWGLGLASIPIILHLLFRRRFRRIEWAPMKYLKLTIQRNRRRIQIEQLLLLLLRTAIVLLLFFIVARPVLHMAGLGEWLGTGSRASKLIVLDDSLSMGLVTADQTAFDRATDLARDIIRGLGPQDRLTVVVTSKPKSPLFREVDLHEEEKILKQLRDHQPTEMFGSWAATMQAVDELLASSTYPDRELTIITDMRRAGWERDMKSLADKWANQNVRLRVFDVGGQSKQQVALEGLESKEPFALLGVPTRWEAIVQNNSQQDLERLEATFIVDGKPSQVNLPALPAGEHVRVPLVATFQEPGLHYLSLQLPTDDLLGDNQRWSVAAVKEQLHIVLVDGEPSGELLQSETDFLSLALSLGGAQASGFQVDIITDAEIGALGATQPDLLVLTNVATIAPQQAQLLRSLVESGMGLMIFVGDQVDPDNYNQVLQNERIGLLPTALETIAEESVSGLQLDDDPGSALEAMRQLAPAVLERIRTEKYYRTRMPADPVKGVRVLARWNDTDSSPAVIEKIVGKGRVLLWTVTADKAWTDWPTQPSYVLAMREASKMVSRRDSGTHDLVAGDVLKQPVRGDVAVRDPAIEVPGSDRPKPAQIEEAEPATGSSPGNASASTKFLTFTDTAKAGLYRMTWATDPGGPGNTWFGVNPDPRESDLTPIAAAELKSLWGVLEPEIIVAGAGSQVTTQGQEIWKTLATCLLVMLVVESCFATWCGRQR